jgi:type III secretion system FlhB-like substrate exporter
MEKMPVGQYKHISEYNIKDLINDVLNEKLFGFVEVDIKVPDELYDKFSEMSPVFKNITIDATDENIIGEHMFDYCKQNKIPLHKSKKLIGSMFGEKILLYTPLLKWYLEHGLIITKFYDAISYDSCVCFKELGETIADARRAGDVDKSMEIIAETMKLIGNSLYGRCVMNKEKHISMTYANKKILQKELMTLILKI